MASPAQVDSSIRIAELRIQDFRAITDLCLPLDDLTVLVGENNVGKTTLLRALEIAIGQGTFAADDDLHVSEAGRRSDRFVVDVKIVPETGDEFSQPIAVRFGDSVRIREGERQFVVIRTTGEPTSDGSGPNIQRRFLADWACERAAASRIIELERPNREQLTLLSFFLLDARRDIVEEMRQRRSYWGRLLADVGMSASDKDSLEAQLRTLGEAVVGSSSVLTTLSDELNRVREALSSAVSSVSIEALPARIDEVARAVDILLKAPGSAALPLRLQGMGSRSLAVVMVFQAFARLRLGADQDIQPLSFSAFEEPEAHLHPHPQRAMFNLINRLPGQKIVSTHSPYVVQVADLFQIRVLRKTGASVSGRWIPRVNPDGSATFNPEALALAQRFVQRHKGEVLFARCVVLCEGETEEGFLPVVAESDWNVAPDSRGITIIGSEGVQNLKHHVRVLEHLGLPWLIFVDGDAEGRKAIEGVERSIGRATTPDEVFMLSNDLDFERYLVAEGFRAELESAAARMHGSTALADYRASHDGRLGPKNVLRDYQTTGWEARLIVDFCKNNMKSVPGGATIAQEVVASVSAGTQAALPTAVGGILARADSILRSEAQ
jgi:putative ATP-dependent endonuclease of OLD family